MNNKQAFIGLGMAFVGGTTLGAGVGYILAHRKLITEYENILVEENKKTRDFYAKMYKHEEYATPQDAAETLGVAGDETVENAAEAIKKYQGVTVKPEDLVVEDTISDAVYEATRVAATEFDDRPQDVVEKNIWDEDGDEAILAKRDKSKPYVITQDELVDPENRNDKVYLTYYLADNVLADDGDQLIEKVDEIVGHLNLTLFGVGSDSKDVVLVRNDRISTDFEITQVTGSYARIVLQMGVEDSIQHSAEPMRRRKNHLRDE